MSSNMCNKISAVILAAGKASRMGAQKLLMHIGGKTLLEEVLDCVNASGMFNDVVGVYSNEEVGEILRSSCTKAVLNSNPEKGLSSSIKLGVQSLSDSSEAVMFFSGDQPFITKELIENLIGEFIKNKKCIIVPVYGETNGMPTIFPLEWKPALLELEGDVGGRVIIKNNPDKVMFVKIEQQEAGFDIDTMEDYEKATYTKKNKL